MSKRVYLSQQDLLFAIEKREKELLFAKQFLEKELLELPDGYVKICNKNNQTQYYHVDEKKSLQPLYIKKKDKKFAQQLAQKSYDQDVLKEIQRELDQLSKWKKQYHPEQIMKKYDSLSIRRKELVEPIVLPDDLFCKRWESSVYESKKFQEDAPEFYTIKKERVRSKSEIMIADMLHREGILYKYECPLLLDETYTVYPDFTCLNVKEKKIFIWEHLGMMDQPEYVERAIKKINRYMRNGFFPGINLILTYETRSVPLSTITVEQVIRTYLK